MPFCVSYVAYGKPIRPVLTCNEWQRTEALEKRALNLRARTISIPFLNISRVGFL